MITTIIFDLSEVQIKGLLGVEKRLAPMLNLDESQILSKLGGVDAILFFNGKITENEYISRTINKNKWHIESETLKKLIRENFQEIDGTREIIIRLRSRGYKLGLLSVHGKEWIDYISQKFAYKELFHATSYSFEDSVSKPDKMAYRKLLRKLDSSPSESVFIDDSAVNLAPAKELGLKTVLFVDHKRLEKELITLGLQF